MKNLATKNNTDFSIFENGDAFISQTKVAELCGVEQPAISKYVEKTRNSLKLNEINQLDHTSLELVIGWYRTKICSLSSFWI